MKYTIVQIENYRLFLYQRISSQLSCRSLNFKLDLKPQIVWTGTETSNLWDRQLAVHGNMYSTLTEYQYYMCIYLREVFATFKLIPFTANMTDWCFFSLLLVA